MRIKNGMVRRDDNVISEIISYGQSRNSDSAHIGCAYSGVSLRL